MAGGFGLTGTAPLLGRIEESFRRRIEDLPKDTRLLMLAAAAEPTGDSALVWRAARRLGVSVQDGMPAVEAGLVEFGAQVRFRRPLVRSAAHGSASAQDLQKVHRALAEAIDPAADPDRRAWHLAQATAVLDEDVAVELERSAGRAQARGGLAAAAAFLERAAILTPDPVRRAQRLLAGARAKRDAGALDAALGLLVAVEAGPLSPLQTAEVEHMRGQIALDQRRGGDAARLLLSAARRLEPLDAALAREVYLEALWEAAMWAGDLDIPGGVPEVAEAARATLPGLDPPRAVDVLLEAFALWLMQGHAAAAPALARALELVLALDFGTDETGRWLWLAGGRISQIIALELWDAESWYVLAARQAEFARGAGALLHLQFALNYLARAHLLAGDLATTALMIEEDRLIAEATGNPPVAHNATMLAAWRGRERETSELIEASLQQATARGLSRVVSFAAYAKAVLNNGLGRPEAACDAARQAFDRDQLGYGPLVYPSWPRQRPGPVTSRSSRRPWTGCPNGPRCCPPTGRWGSRPGSVPCSAAPRPSPAIASRSSASAGPGSAPSSLAVTCCTGSGCAASAAAPRHGSTCARPTRCWTRWVSGRSPNGPGLSCRPRGRPPASVRSRRPWS
jgi:hypothetical protein